MDSGDGAQVEVMSHAWSVCFDVLRYTVLYVKVVCSCMPLPMCGHMSLSCMCVCVEPRQGLVKVNWALNWAVDRGGGLPLCLGLPGVRDALYTHSGMCATVFCSWEVRLPLNSLTSPTHFLLAPLPGWHLMTSHMHKHTPTSKCPQLVSIWCRESSSVGCRVVWWGTQH